MKRMPFAPPWMIACLLAAMCRLALASEDPRLEYSRALLKQAGKPAPEFKLDETLGHPEAFRVAKAGGKTVIEYGSPAGAVYGALAVARGESVPGVVEKPDFDIRGTTLCLMGVQQHLQGDLLPGANPWFFDRAFMERTLDSLRRGAVEHDLPVELPPVPLHSGAAQVPGGLRTQARGASAQPAAVPLVHAGVRAPEHPRPAPLL